MASSSLINSTSRLTPLQLLLEEIKFQQQKDLQYASTQDVDGYMNRGTTYWTHLFVSHVLFQAERSSIDADDLLFFIRKKRVRNTLTLPKYQTDVEVFRKDSKKLPIGDPEIEWKDTVILNVIIHQLEYTLTLAICTRTSPKDLQVLKRHSQKVYASPSRRRMDTKGDFEEITYPFLSFMVDNFDEVFGEIAVRDGEMVCVELLATDRDQAFQAVLFLGSIRYDALKRVYDQRISFLIFVASIGSKVAQRMTFGLFSGTQSQRVEYVRLKGPYGKGHAEIAVSKPKGAMSCETPTSEPDGIWGDSGSESDSEDFVFRHHRRLSDPSSNLNTYARSGWKSMKGNREGGTCSTSTGGEYPPKRTRSQNEDMDFCGVVAEIEAGDPKDAAEKSGHVWCCGCCGCCCSMNPHTSSNSNANNDLSSRPRLRASCCSNSSSSETDSTTNIPTRCNTCCVCPSPFPRSQSLALDNIPLHPIRRPDANCTVRGNRRFPLLTSRTVVNPPSSSSRTPIATTFALDKSSSISCLTDAKFICKEKLLRTFPNKLTTTGVRVLYLCDYAKASDDKTAELDDGAYNPLWTRGFSQSFHVWRETRRAQSVPLNAFLTYITLPCSSIMKDILENREEPVLTF